MSAVITRARAPSFVFPCNIALYFPHGRAPRAGESPRADGTCGARFSTWWMRRPPHVRGRVPALPRRATHSIAAISPGDRQRFRGKNGGGCRLVGLAVIDRASNEPVRRNAFGGIAAFTCGPWCQGPTMLQALNLLERLRAAQRCGHNSIDYLHTLIEAVKLVFADREAYFGDPPLFGVPIAALLSSDYAHGAGARCCARTAPGPKCRQSAIPREWTSARMGYIGAPLRPTNRSAPAKPRHVPRLRRRPPRQRIRGDAERRLLRRTAWSRQALIPSSRGSQSGPTRVTRRASPRQATALDPQSGDCDTAGRVGDAGSARRAATSRSRQSAGASSTSLVFGMEAQQAVEAPRVASYSFPASFEPHAYHPGTAQPGEPDRPADRRGARPPRPQGRSGGPTGHG